MLTRIFGQINSATQIMVGVYALLLAGLHVFFHPGINGMLKTAFGVVYVNAALGYVLSGVLFVAIAFGYQWLWFGKYKLVKHHAYVPIIMLPLLLINTNSLNTLLLLGHLALLIAIFKTWLETYQSQRLYQQSLNTGLLLGFGALFDVQYVLLLFLTYVVYIIFGRLSFRTVLIPLIGYLTIWFIAILLDYLLLDSTYVFNQFGKHFSLPFQSGIEPGNSSKLIVLGMLFLAGLSEFVKTVSRAAVFKRQSFTIYFILFVLAVLAYFFAGNGLLQLAAIIATVTLLAVNYVQYLKKAWVKELILWAILVLFGIFEAGLL